MNIASGLHGPGAVVCSCALQDHQSPPACRRRAGLRPAPTEAKPEANPTSNVKTTADSGAKAEGKRLKRRIHAVCARVAVEGLLFGGGCWHTLMRGDAFGVAAK